MKSVIALQSRVIVQVLKMLVKGCPGFFSLLLCKLGTLHRRIVSMLRWNIVFLALALTKNSRLHTYKLTFLVTILPVAL